MKRAIVTGGSSGIGRATVDQLCAGGSIVEIIDQSPPTHSLPERARLHQLDITRTDDLLALLARLQSPEDPITSLVCCAGKKLRKSLPQTTVEEWDYTHHVNLRAAAFAVGAVLPSMVEHRAGSIVLLGSPSANGDPTSPMYASAKAGLIGLAASVALSVASTGVRINTVVPALTQTAMTAHVSDAVLQAAGRWTASGEANQPTDVANAITFLLGDGSRNVSGAVLEIGRTAGEAALPHPAPTDPKGRP